MEEYITDFCIQHIKNPIVLMTTTKNKYKFPITVYDGPCNTNTLILFFGNGTILNISESQYVCIELSIDGEKSKTNTYDCADEIILQPGNKLLSSYVNKKLLNINIKDFELNKDIKHIGRQNIYPIECRFASSCINFTIEDMPDISFVSTVELCSRCNSIDIIRDKDYTMTYSDNTGTTTNVTIKPTDVSNITKIYMKQILPIIDAERLVK